MKKIRYYSNFIMVAIYILLGLLFLFSDLAIEAVPSYRKALGLVLIGYGCLRMLLSVKKIKEEEDERI